MKLSLVLSSVFALPVLSRALAEEAELKTQSTHRGRTCKEYSIPLTVTSSVYDTKYERFKDNFDVTSWVNNLARRDPSAYQPLSVNLKSVTAKYAISATFWYAVFSYT